MGKSPCCKKVGLKKGPWTPEEDQKLLAYIQQHGHGSWRALPSKAGLKRCGKSCRLRWINYLRPDIKRGKFSLQEEQTIIQLHALLGNRWSAIATHMPKRTDNEIKNYWNTHLKKRLTKMGIDPVTHKPKNTPLGSDQSRDTANLNHMAQWEIVRLEAEARLVRESKTTTPNYHHPIGSSASAQLMNKATAPPTQHHPQLVEPMLPPCLDILKAWQGLWAKPNGFFTSNNGSLESPTSIFHFSDNMLTFSTNGIGANSTLGEVTCVENSNACNQLVGITKETIQGGWKGLRKPNDELKIGDKVEIAMLLDGIADPIDAASIADSLSLPSSLESLEGLLSDNTDVYNISALYEDLDTSCGGGLEDNKKY